MWGPIGTIYHSQPYLIQTYILYTSEQRLMFFFNFLNFFEGGGAKSLQLMIKGFYLISVYNVKNSKFHFRTPERPTSVHEHHIYV
jgi:hypothetical protein